MSGWPLEAGARRLGAASFARRRRAAAPSPARRVLLAGAFGQGNPGDEALLRAFVRALPGWRPVALTSAPEATAAEHGVETVHRDDPAAVLRALRAADAVVVAGGSVFKALHPACGRRPGALLRRLAALAVAAKAARTPIALVGVGAGDLEGAAARRLSRTVVQAADLLILRDEESADELAAAGATAPFRVGADAAWTVLEAPDGAPSRNGDGEIVVALNHLGGGADLVERLAAGLAPFDGVQLQPWQPEDVALAHVLSARLDGARVVSAPAGLQEAVEAFAGARLVIGLRFHALLAAAAAGVPFVAYAHEHKLAALARRLRQPAVTPGGDLAAAVRAALAGAPPDAAAVRRERRLAEEGFRMLRVVVAGGRTEEAVALDGLALRPQEWLV
jgi:polysaccharide pyruvyl transferase WcaK-like protein